MSVWVSPSRILFSMPSFKSSKDFLFVLSIFFSNIRKRSNAEKEIILWGKVISGGETESLSGTCINAIKQGYPVKWSGDVTRLLDEKN